MDHMHLSHVVLASIRAANLASSITLGGNSESRGLFIAGQGPASTTSEGDLVVSDESDEATVAIDWVKSRVLNTVAV